MRSPTTLRTSMTTVNKPTGVGKILVMAAVVNNSVARIGTSSSDGISAKQAGLLLWFLAKQILTGIVY
jgi:hypothetical protein